MRCVTVIAVAVSLVLGQAAAILAQNGPPSKDRYIIVLKPPKNGVPELSDHDITAGGGKVEYRVPGCIQVILPAPAVEALRKQERVKYIQKVILGPLPDASAPPELWMTPSTASLRATAESTPPTWRSGTYKYDASGNIYAIGVAGDTGSPVQHRYAYDELSRLKQADTLTTPTHTETFTYDVYGNLIEHVDGSSTTSTPVEDPNTNRLAWSAAHPYTYDAAGNLTADYNATYAYDPFNMLREKDSGSKQEFYIYTANDERIGVKYGTSSGSPTIWSIRDFSGNVLRQYEGHDQVPQMAWLWVEDYIYRNGQLLAAERVPEEGGRRHFHLDHLGSPRLVTGQDSKEMSDHDYEPFGLESNYQETAGGFDREDPKRFTGHERDYAAPPDAPASAYYLDYMHARFYSPNVGRFLSVDPALGSQMTPQSWNRYGYAKNNPGRYTDPSGLDPCTVSDAAINGGAPFESDCTTVTAKNPTEGEHRIQLELNDMMEAVSSLSGFFKQLDKSLDKVGLRPQGGSPCGPNVKCGMLVFGPVAASEELTLLNKSLASESQLADAQEGIGESIAGEGSTTPLKDLPRLVAEYGPGRWAKMTTEAYKAADGHIIETHFYKNMSTGQVVEIKVTLPWH